MPTGYDLGRIAKARQRLQAHPAMESGPQERTNLPPFEPHLLRRLAQQHGPSTNILADRALMAAIARPATRGKEPWTRGATAGVLAAGRTALADVGQTQPPSKRYAASVAPVDDALAAAALANAALQTTREQLRALHKAVRTAHQAKMKAQAKRAFPAEWENLGPRAENPAPPTAKADAHAHAHAAEGEGDDDVTQMRDGKAPAVDADGAQLEEGKCDDAEVVFSDEAKHALVESVVDPLKANARCAFCPEGERNDTGDTELLGPFVTAAGKASLYVHFDCACWAPQVFADPKTSKFRGVYDEYRRGRQLKCSHCRGKGATVGCYIEKCKRVFHYRCLQRSGARMVTEYFAAFCSKHAHLADKDTYQLMMRAHTIADVAAARRETTDGLDAPHSRYTKLRRRDTEIIFNRRAGTCTASFCYDHAKALFSLSKRKVIANSEPFGAADRVRLIRHSAIAVASGYFAFNAAKRQDVLPLPTATATNRRAVPLFLLRNLQGAPNWTQDDIKVDKHARKRSLHFNVRMKKLARHAAAAASPSPTAKRASPDDDNAPSPARKSRRTGSVQLPEPNRRLRAAIRLHGLGPVGSPQTPSASPDSILATPPLPARRSGWNSFLAEQLPRERVLRPDDDNDAAMANMARLWSLLTRAERAKYEARSNHDPPPPPTPSLGWLGPSAGGAAAGAGLFTVRPAPPPPPPADAAPAPSASASATATARPRVSFAVGAQRRRWRDRSHATDRQENAEANVDWDAMFPIDLTPDGGKPNDESASVRPPPELHSKK